jgi:tetratricopeptide (TPR) repeat protein
MRPRSSFVVALMWAGAAAAQSPAPAPAPAAAAAPAPTGIGVELGALTKVGVIDPKTGNTDTLKADLALAERALGEERFLEAAAMLYLLVESPRYADFSDDPAYLNSEYDLIVALARAGASHEALHYVERVLARGVKSPYFEVANRRAVDIALDTRDYLGVLKRLEAVPVKDPLPPGTLAERDYLRGRGLYDTGNLDDAERELAQVTRKSRLYSSSVYLRAVLRVRQGKLKDATDAFCEIATTPDQDKFTFYIDDRYFGIRDLAQLGAGRIAHEEGRYDDAYYHYFQIPDDSDRLPEALFEAAWSMYQKRELRTARDLTKEFLKDFPTSPLVPEATLLAGYIELADCKFEEGRKYFEALAKDMGPILVSAEFAQGSTSMRRTLMTRALERVGPRGPIAAPRPLTADPEDRVLAMLRLDPSLVRLNDTLAGLRREASLSSYAVTAWRELLMRVTQPEGQVATAKDEAATQARGATELASDARRLREDVRREHQALLEAVRGKAVSPDEAALRLPELESAETALRELETRARAQASAADQKIGGGGDPELRKLLAAELDRSSKLAEQTREVSETFDRTADELAQKELARVRAQLIHIVERARLGRIDSVIGEKRKAEKDIEDITNDTWVPPEIGAAMRHRLIGEDEEYWPQEEEIWDDEYSRFR